MSTDLRSANYSLLGDANTAHQYSIFYYKDEIMKVTVSEKPKRFCYKNISLSGESEYSVGDFFQKPGETCLHIIQGIQFSPLKKPPLALVLPDPNFCPNIHLSASTVQKVPTVVFPIVIATQTKTAAPPIPPSPSPTARTPEPPSALPPSTPRVTPKRIVRKQIKS